MATPINRLFIDEQFTQRVRVEQSTPRPDVDVDQPAKKAFTVSPTASVNASTISTAAPCEATGPTASREWSASSSIGMPSPPDFRPSTDTPLPERPSRLSSVVNFFKRSSSTHRYRSSSQHQDDRLNQRVRETKDAVRGQVEELESLKRQLAANEAELEMRRQTIESLEGTHQHAQELLKRNSELEMLIASVQDEADAMLLKERELRRKAHEEVNNANQRADNYNSRILSLETELRDAQQSSRVNDDILQLRRSIAEKEAIIVKLRSELSGAEVELKELKGVIERERMALEKLTKERQAHMNNIAGVSVELKGLLEQNNDLEEELRASSERHERLIEEMKLKLKEANSEGQARAQGAARLQAELQVAEANWRRAEENLAATRKQNDELRLRSAEVESMTAEIEHLRVTLAESEERRTLEKDHSDETTRRLKEQIASLQGIHKRAESLLQRNSELERLLANFTDKLSAAVGDDAPIVRRLRADLQASTSELRNAEQRVKTQENDLKLLESTLRDTKRRLQAAEMEVERRRRVEGTSLQTAAGESFQVALEKALSANTDSTRREIARLQREYDGLIRNIREAHTRELKAQEEGLQERIRAAEADKDAEFATALRQKEREWAELQKAQDRALQEAQRNLTQLEATLERMREAMKAQDEEVRTRVENVRRAAEQETAERIADLKRSLEGLVAHATTDLQKEVESLKHALAQAQQDRDAAVDENLKLGRSVNQLKATVEEKEAALAQMTRQYQEYEKSTTRQVEELRNMIRSQKGSNTAEDHDDLRRMLKRNEELEAMIAEMSEKFHNELRIHMEEVAKTRRQKLDMESRVNSMTRELSQLQAKSQNSTGLSEADKADLDRRIVDLTAQLARSEAQKKALSDELENERKRLQVLQKRPHRMSEGRRDWKTGLMERLAELQNLAQTYRQAPVTSVADLESARSAAEQKRLAAEIDHLKTQVLERQEKIETLEGNLQAFRTARPIQDTEKDQLRSQLQSLRGERQTLADECSILEESLRKQRQTLAAEITRRDKQLNDLTRTNDELGRALKRNAELETQLNKMFADLRHKLSSSHRSGQDMGYTSVFETLSAFETEFRSRTFQYDMDIKQLVSTLDDREAEVFRLQQELVDLRQDLQRNHQQHIDSQRLQFEAERDALLSENRGLRDVQNKLQTELDRLRKEVAEAQAVDSERVTRMVTELNNKISEHQLLVAELADEKDNEVRRIEAKLRLSMAAQDRLRVEIDKVTSELGNKEADIAELSSTIKRIMAENGITPEGLEEGNSGSEEWATMIGTIEVMFSRLSRSRKDAGNLCSTLNALLQEQQRSLREIAESQMAASKLRDQMSNALGSAQDEPLGRTVIRTSFGVKGGRISGLDSTLADIDKEMETVRQAHMDLLAAQTNQTSRLSSRVSVMSQHTSRQVTRTSTVEEEVSSPTWRHEAVSDTSNKRKISSSRTSESKRAKLSTD